MPKYYALRLPARGDTVLLVVRDKRAVRGQVALPVFRPITSSELHSLPWTCRIELSHWSDEEGVVGESDLRLLGGAVVVSESGSNLAVRYQPMPPLGEHESADVAVSLALNWLLCRRGLFSLHSASVLDRGRGYLFAGPSGSGKTTLCDLASEHATVLCDECSTVTRTAHGWSVFPGPRWAPNVFKPAFYRDGYWNYDHQDESRHPLAGVCFLARRGGVNTSIVPVPQTRAAFLLLWSFFSSRFSRPLPSHAVPLVLEAAAQLARQVPCFELSLRLASGAWPTLRRLLDEASSPSQGRDAGPPSPRVLIGDDLVVERFLDGALVLRMSDLRLFEIACLPEVPVSAISRMLGDLGGLGSQLQDQSVLGACQVPGPRLS